MTLRIDGRPYKWGEVGAREAARRKLLAKRVFAHYGTSCECCGRRTDLSIDHIYGAGTAHRQSLGKPLYEWLIANEFPAGFQTLCLSCNRSKGEGAYCKRHPHRYKRRATVPVWPDTGTDAAGQAP